MASGDEKRGVRACDSCLCRRARWFCAADDAFLCQSCDAAVHSANPLASRHERVKLKVASSHVLKREVLPSWMKGLRKKARTPRARPGVVLVPDIASPEEHSTDDGGEDQLLYRVPIYDPMVAELCSSSRGSRGFPMAAGVNSKNVTEGQATSDVGHAVDSAQGFLPSDEELAEFAADVETLLGRGLYEESAFCMDGLGLMEAKDDNEMDCSFLSSNYVGKLKLELDAEVDGEAGSGAEPSIHDTLELNFDYDSPGEDEEMSAAMEEKPSQLVAEAGDLYADEEEKKVKIALRLDYKSVMVAWASQGSPWTTGDRPRLNPDDPWPDCIGGFALDAHLYGGGRVGGGPDGDREARVSRYREKRRTRLFSKKIRYEVRKLNAEKRPRMKGRFVKRASFAAEDFGI